MGIKIGKNKRRIDGALGKPDGNKNGGQMRAMKQRSTGATIAISKRRN